MNVNKNSYTIGFASVMVIIVAALLAYTSISLTPYQDRNIELEKKQNILQSVGVEVERDNSEIIYSQYIKEELIIDDKGNVLDGSAFDVDLGVEVKKNIADQKLPLYISILEDSSRCFIIPLRGKGLWGPIWGYIALKEDVNTVFGAVFAHKSETPGLGAEINQSFFQEPFRDKKIFNSDDEFVSITVIKGGAPEGSMHAVDGISGGTITSDGVTDMIKERVSRYLPYIEKNKPVSNDTLMNLNLISKVYE
ncbi:NADH:ubiquinone reductase (Na(+)-transporting) subunit C [Flavobacteriales bacterium]|jgi:Na+-transporting NADH:ubiquinone oxidoreductase subunit C|nr:NADH:ubiquinone reductase (Na(+)-transporting) subunit C [Flavobacteriales bacterium]|tara:strand:- start:656 stop:1408 length:753 start_codon:yes stop_codon:yes gene_type:complete